MLADLHYALLLKSILFLKKNSLLISTFWWLCLIPVLIDSRFEKARGIGEASLGRGFL